MTPTCSKCNKRPAVLECQPDDADHDVEMWSHVCEECLKILMGEDILRVRRIGKK